jgi:hypothetical protein
LGREDGGSAGGGSEVKLVDLALGLLVFGKGGAGAVRLDGCGADSGGVVRIAAGELRRLVLRGSVLDVVDHENSDWAFARIQLQTELLLDGCEQ